MNRAYRALVVDDEELARAVVKEHLAAHPEIELVGECANGFEAVKAVAELAPDLIFLDIQMPKLDGFEVLELISDAKAPQRLPSIVFVTAFDQHALRAFEAHAVDYVLKPFSESRFEESLAKAKARADAGIPTVAHPAELSAKAREAWPLERIVVRDGPKVTLIPLAKLDYAQGADDYVELRSEGRSYLKQQTMASLESQLDPSRFLRIHRSVILQMDRLVRLEQLPSESWVAVLSDTTKLPVSKSGMGRVKAFLGETK
jgi:two-component system LytT family response regulator